MSIATFPLIADADTREQSNQTPAYEPDTKSPRVPPRRVGRLLLRLRGGGYCDPLFERPDLVEDDYYRLINQPRGW